MTLLDRRRLVPLAAAFGLAASLAGCSSPEMPQVAAATPPAPAKMQALRETDQIGTLDTGDAADPALKPAAPVVAAKFDPKFAALYQPVANDKFPVKGLAPSVIRKGFERKEVDYVSKEEPGTIVIDPHKHYLYYIMPGGRAMRYGVAVGKQGFSWSGTAIIKTKQEWPDWYPPKEMIDRHPELKAQLDKLQSGMGVAGGLRNPLGARAMYLWQNNKDTYFRIHGTLEPHSIGTNASSGCIRLINQDAMDLYARVIEGSKVVVLGNDHPTVGVAKNGSPKSAPAKSAAKGAAGTKQEG